MKMRNLLFGVILGLLAVVHSTPPNLVTQDDVYKEAETDGYLVNPQILNPYTTESPKRIGISQESQQPSTDPKVSDMPEGSGDSDNFSTSIFLQQGDKHHATTTQSVSNAQTIQQPSTESKVNDIIEGSGDTSDKFLKSIFPQHGGKHYATTTQSVLHAQTVQQPSTESKVSDIIEGSGDPDDSSSSKASSRYIYSSVSYDSGSREKTIDQFPDTRSRTTDISNTPTKSSTSSAALIQNLAPRLVNESKAPVSAVSSVHEQQKFDSSHEHPGHSTPGWIIIVAFIVGVAALVMLCVAIATRDKWNGPKRTPLSETNSSNQQRELEMVTFLHKDQPTENGHASEYTVIPLEELPERYSSH